MGVVQRNEMFIDGEYDQMDNSRYAMQRDFANVPDNCNEEVFQPEPKFSKSQMLLTGMAPKPPLQQKAVRPAVL